VGLGHDILRGTGSDGHLLVGATSHRDCGRTMVLQRRRHLEGLDIMMTTLEFLAVQVIIIGTIVLLALDSLRIVIW
jgi:hypothetical protein